ncbi:semaphorin-5B-like [Mercenaria mercenaria]|uniref:semaphorin-5B-like n=1 Tax=Mercenaria mercenaria TaxID=6596 RepID=UPI00234E3FDE|nr:semaphorin-5B-like [Mercenaria mercenaria]
MNVFHFMHILLLICASIGHIWSEQACDAHDSQALMLRLRQLKTETEIKFKEVTTRIEYLENELADQKDGEWSTWGDWSTCSESCGGGTQSRNRSCTDPAPSKFGKQCLGSSEQITLCNKQQCPDANVAFTATNIDNSTYGESGIRFPNVLVNIGNNYDSAYGTFTTSIPGLYHLVVVLTLDRSGRHTASCQLCVNGVAHFNIYMKRYDDNYSSIAAGTFNLKRNDVIHLCSCNGTQYMNKGNTNMFTGFLIKPL